jgi:ankyrin repeat protein
MGRPIHQFPDSDKEDKEDKAGTLPSSSDFESDEDHDTTHYDPTLLSIIEAIENSEIQSATDLINSIDDTSTNPINQIGPEGDAALHLAALYGHLSIVSLLLSKGAQVDLCDEDGGLPLHDAAAGGYVEICRLLLLHNPSLTATTINAQDNEGDTPLICAVRGSADEVVQLLLNNGADPRKGNEYGDTPLSLAEIDTTRTLIETHLERGDGGGGGEES